VSIIFSAPFLPQIYHKNQASGGIPPKPLQEYIPRFNKKNKYFAKKNSKIRKKLRFFVFLGLQGEPGTAVA
jgi:hypothetical protein